jgi:SAM-dependent methyltransferase
MDYQDKANRDAWSEHGAQRWLTSIQGFTDAGEQAAFNRIAEEMRDQPILDLGVGAGRTIPLLRAISRHYAAIDYLPTMVDIARHKYPDVDIQVGDARDLSRFADASLALVVFSHAGIDAVDHCGREQIFQEASRVLKPHGVFWFSTLNKDGPELRRRPWQLQWPSSSQPVLTYLLNLLRALKQSLNSTRNYLRLERLKQAGEGWLIAPFSAHDYGLLVHYESLAHLREELAAAGFYPDAQAIDPDGKLLQADDDLGGVYFFNILARKRNAAAAHALSV